MADQNADTIEQLWRRLGTYPVTLILLVAGMLVFGNRAGDGHPSVDDLMRLLLLLIAAGSAYSHRRVVAKIRAHYKNRGQTRCGPNVPQERQDGT